MEETALTKLSMEQQLSLPESYGQKLSPELRQQVDALKSSIDMHDRGKVQAYGYEQQASIGKFYDSILEGVGTKEVGEAGDILTKVMGDINGFNADCGNQNKGLFGFLKKQKDRIKTMQARYKTVSENIDIIVRQLQDKERALGQVSRNFDVMYEQNKELFEFLTMVIYAGEQALKEEQAKADQMQAEAEASGDMMELQRIADYRDDITRFERRLYDLKLSRTVSFQQAPQIRSIQKSAEEISESIRTTIVTAIPLWKSQMAMALGMQTVADGVRARNSVLDTTNAMLLANAKANHQLTVEAAKAAERGVVDIDTISAVNQELISAFMESSDIVRDAKTARIEGAKKLEENEAELKRAIAEYASVS